MKSPWLIAALLFLAVQVPLPDAVQAQSVSGVRGLNGGVAPLFNLTGPGNFYADAQGTQGFMYTPGSNFESYNFRVPNGQAWSGAMMTLGPQLSIGLISGANQAAFSAQTGTVQLSSSSTIFPPSPRVLSPLPRVQSSVLDLEEDIP